MGDQKHCEHTPSDPSPIEDRKQSADRDDACPDDIARQGRRQFHPAARSLLGTLETGVWISNTGPFTRSNDMRIGSWVVRHRLIVLSSICGMCISSPAISQPAAPAAAADFDVVEATIDGIHAAMRSGGLRCTQLVQTYLDRIAAYDQAGPKLNAVQNVNPHALKQAADLDAKFKASGEMAPG